MAHGKFGTAINCMDGRVQLPVIEWMKKQYDIDYVDMITEPGPDKFLSSGNVSGVESIKARTLISVEKHGSTIIAVVGHHDCAGNPISKREHEVQVKESMKTVNSWNLPVSVVGLWINENWQVEIID